MKVKVSTIRQKLTELLEKSGYDSADVAFVVNMFLGGELRGHTTHGLASFPSFLKRHTNVSLPKIEIIQSTAACFYADAKGASGNIIGRTLADEAVKRAKQQIVGFSLVKNMASWLRPGAVAQYIADQGLISYVVNSGGGVAIAPPGGYEPVAGTNPIAYGVPTNEGSFVVDMATSKRAWGVVRQANKYDTSLPDDTFYDQSGRITTDPSQAEAVLSFGGYKGFSLALLAEIMCGALTSMPMMVQSDAGDKYGQKMPARGAYILAIDPSQTVGLGAFKNQVSDYLHKIKNTKPLPGQTIRVPGRASMDKSTAAEHNDEIDLPDRLWQEIIAL